MHKRSDWHGSVLRRDRPTELISLLQSLCSRSVCLHSSSAAPALIVWDSQCLILNGARALAQVNVMMASLQKPCCLVQVKGNGHNILHLVTTYILMVLIPRLLFTDWWILKIWFNVFKVRSQTNLLILESAKETLCSCFWMNISPDFD